MCLGIAVEVKSSFLFYIPVNYVTWGCSRVVPVLVVSCEMVTPVKKLSESSVGIVLKRLVGHVHTIFLSSSSLRIFNHGLQTCRKNMLYVCFSFLSKLWPLGSGLYNISACSWIASIQSWVRDLNYFLM